MFPFVDCIITHGNHFVNTFLKFFCNFFVADCTRLADFYVDNRGIHRCEIAVIHYSVIVLALGNTQSRTAYAEDTPEEIIDHLYDLMGRDHEIEVA